MSLTVRERAKLDDFESIYRQGQLPVLQALERRICGCTYGATSWATRHEADRIAAALELGPAVRLLEIGAGSGWPGLYLTTTSGCSTTATDLPFSGLQIALGRAARDGIAGRFRAVLADAEQLPFPDASFEAVNQSDVLCCLLRKRQVLSECRRVIRPRGRMACSVIYVPPGLPDRDHSRAVETAPDFVEAETEYPLLFADTGWAICHRHDLTDAFADSCRNKLKAEEDLRENLEPIIGVAELARSEGRLRRRIGVLERGHLKRELFVLVPASDVSGGGGGAGAQHAGAVQFGDG